MKIWKRLVNLAQVALLVYSVLFGFDGVNDIQTFFFAAIVYMCAACLIGSVSYIISGSFRFVHLSPTAKP